MNLDIQIRKIKNRDNVSYWPRFSLNYIYIHKYKYNDYYILYRYKNKYNFKIEFNIINHVIRYNYCCLYDKQKCRIEFFTSDSGDNKISKFILMNDRYYNYVYSVTIKNTYNVYSLYKYLLSLKYLYKNNNMKNISNMKKFNCMKNYKIIIYIAAIAI
jgi:hypothetical protein